VFADPPPPAPLARRIARLEQGFSGRLGFWALDLGRGEFFGHNAGQVFPAASTIKLFILRELFRQAAADLVDLDHDTVEMQRDDVTRGSGVIKDLTPGLRLSLRDAATLMITVSDNTATNLLIRRLGARTINEQTRAAGFEDTHLSGVFFKGRGLSGTVTSPRDLGAFMAEVARRGPRPLLEILDREQSANIIGRLIPYDPYAKGRDRWRLASKSGSMRGVRNDAGYVRGPGCRYVLALMSDGCADERFGVDNEANLCLARIAAEVHHWVTR
jgi:beta-lactamase class A